MPACLLIFYSFSYFHNDQLWVYPQLNQITKNHLETAEWPFKPNLIFITFIYYNIYQ